MKTILVAVDLSDVTMKMVKVAVHLAKPFQSKIILMHAVEHAQLLSSIGGDPISAAPSEEVPADRTEALSRLQEMISLVGLDSTKLELQGPPVDLIVLGSHNHGFFDHLFTGSVVDGILQRAKCPVLIVPLHD